MKQFELNFPDTRFTFADFFSGCGGFSLGLINAGLKCISAFEINTDASWTYWTNLCYKGWSHLWVNPDDKKTIKRIKKWKEAETTNDLWTYGVPDNWLEVEDPMPCMNLFVMDIMSIEPEDWLKLCGVRVGDISIFVGGPPCQGFSTANTSRNMLDERNQLPLRMIYYAKVCKPKYVLIENVPGIVTLGRKKGEKEGPFVHWIREAFADAGYEMEWEIHNAADYGVPQNRKRVIFFASRKDIKEPKLSLNLKKEEEVNVLEAIGDMPSLQAGETYEGEPFGYNAREGYVICRSCYKYNKKHRIKCHHCKKDLKKPITGGVFFVPENGLKLVDCKNQIDKNKLIYK